MQAMLDDRVAPKLKTGAAHAVGDGAGQCARRRHRRPLGAIAKAHPDVAIGSYPFLDEEKQPNTNVVVRSRDAGSKRRRGEVQCGGAEADAGARRMGTAGTFQTMRERASPETHAQASDRTPAPGESLSRCRGTSSTATAAP